MTLAFILPKKRNLLLRPVGRTRLLVAKLVSMVVYVLAAVVQLPCL